jgi:hypothetical protein
MLLLFRGTVSHMLPAAVFAWTRFVKLPVEKLTLS